jgi:hypothetical protein
LAWAIGDHGVEFALVVGDELVLELVLRGQVLVLVVHLLGTLEVGERDLDLVFAPLRLEGVVGLFGRAVLPVGVRCLVDLRHGILFLLEVRPTGVCHARGPLVLELHDGGQLLLLLPHRVDLVHERLVLVALGQVVSADLVLRRALAAGVLPVVFVAAAVFFHRGHLFFARARSVEDLVEGLLLRRRQCLDVLLVGIDELLRLGVHLLLLLGRLVHAVAVLGHPFLGVAVFVVERHVLVLRLVDGRVVEALFGHAGRHEFFDLLLLGGRILFVVGTVHRVVVLGHRRLGRVEFAAARSAATGAAGERE